MVHELKIAPIYLKKIISGRKTFEVRKNDHNYNEGDYLYLRGFENGKYLSIEAMVIVSYILNDPEYCKEGYIIMGIKNLEIPRTKQQEDALKIGW